MIIKISKKSHLQNLEHSQFAINLHAICTEANIEKVNALLPALKTCIDKEEQALNLPRGKEFITEIRQLDAARDESYRALQFTVRAAKHRRAADSIAPNHSTPRNADSVPFGASHGRSCRR